MLWIFVCGIEEKTCMKHLAEVPMIGADLDMYNQVFPQQPIGHFSKSFSVCPLNNLFYFKIHKF